MRKALFYTNVVVIRSQAWTARQAELAAADQTREVHLIEQVRQREHEQMLSQIARTDLCASDRRNHNLHPLVGLFSLSRGSVNIF